MCGSLCARRMIVLFGPTAVGKTAASLSVAKWSSAEIINMDVGQLYEPFAIGTAKPDWLNASVAHHLFDVIDQPSNYTVVEYRKKVLEKAHELWSQGKTPVLVGGSGFYLKSLLFPPHDDQKVSSDTPCDVSWEALHAIDPDRAQKIKKTDMYRIKRALDIWQKTGKKPSECVPNYDPPACMTLICLKRDRAQLYDRINQRVDCMIDEGWLDEVRGLLGTKWIPFIKRKKLIGYNELVDYLNDGGSLSLTLEVIKKKTRNYAKRQETFWRMIERQIAAAQGSYKGSLHVNAHVANLTLHDVPLYIKQFLVKST